MMPSWFHGVSLGFPGKVLLNLRKRLLAASQQAAAATLQLLDREGIFAGLSSGAVVHQAIKVANEMKEGNILAMLADGGWKYLSLDFWARAK